MTGPVATLFLLLLFFALGAGRLEVERRLLPSNHVDRLPEEMLEEPLWVEGIVVSPTDPLAGEPRGAESAAGRIRILLDLRRIWLEGREIEVGGRARLTLLQPQIVPAYGDRIRGLFKLRRPRGYLNPAGFDYPLYLRTLGVTLEGWVGEGDVMERRGTGEELVAHGGVCASGSDDSRRDQTPAAGSGVTAGGGHLSERSGILAVNEFLGSAPTTSSPSPASM
jgi:hypothetical protein